MKRTPIAVFVYNRADKISQVLQSLANCEKFEECEAYFFCDGAKTETHLAGVLAARQVVSDWVAQYGGTVIEHDNNLGLARSIATGVSQLCAAHGRVIVIEDDLLLSPDFLVFMLAGLDRYADDDQVMQISGYVYPIKHTGVDGAFFLPLTTAWGWATWQRAWQHFDLHPDGVTEFLADAEQRKRFTLGGAYHYDSILEQTSAGEIDTWDIQWWYIVFRTNGVVLYPEKSLVLNMGFDKSGVNTSGGLNPTANVQHVALNHMRLRRPLVFPQITAVNTVMFARVSDYLRQWEKRNIALKRRQDRRRWLRRLLRQLMPVRRHSG